MSQGLIARSLCWRAANSVYSCRVTHYGTSLIPVCTFSIWRKQKCRSPEQSLSSAVQTAQTFPVFVPVQFLASKSPKREGKGKAKPVTVPAEELQDVVDFPEFESSLQNLVSEFRELLSKQFALRTSAASFEAITVEIDGRKQALNSIVQIAFKTPQLVMLNLSATPNYIPSVTKALESSGLNLSPQVEGHHIYIPVPKVSRDHRENLAKNAKTCCNNFKDRLRAVQNNYVRKAKNRGDKSEDLVRNVVQMIMERAEKCGKELDSLLEAKQKDLLSTQ